MIEGLTLEFWAIVVVGSFVWFALVDGVTRILAALARLESGVTRVHIALNDEPDLSIIAPKIGRMFRERRIGD